MKYHHLFHQASKRIAQVPFSMRDWPTEWKENRYKVYEGAQVHILPHSTQEKIPFTAQLGQLLLNRKTEREFSTTSYITIEQLGSLLAFSCGELDSPIQGVESKNRRTYASAGALYPLEAYVLLFTPVDAISEGLYHYRPDTHTLEELQSRFHKEENESMFGSSWVQDASCVMFITGMLERTISKYQERGYRFVLLEAGQMTGNITLVAQALGLSTAQIGSTNDEDVERLLDIDGITEVVLSTLVVGNSP